MKRASHVRDFELNLLLGSTLRIGMMIPCAMIHMAPECKLGFVIHLYIFESLSRKAQTSML